MRARNTKTLLRLRNGLCWIGIEPSCIARRGDSGSTWPGTRRPPFEFAHPHAGFAHSQFPSWLPSLPPAPRNLGPNPLEGAMNMYTLPNVTCKRDSRPAVRFCGSMRFEVGGIVALVAQASACVYSPKPRTNTHRLKPALLVACRKLSRAIRRARCCAGGRGRSTRRAGSELPAPALRIGRGHRQASRRWRARSSPRRVE